MVRTNRALASLSLLLAFVVQPAASVGGAAALPLPAAPGRTGPSANGPQSPSSAAWYDGLIQYSTITNCGSIIMGSPYTEYGAGTFVGFLADPNASVPAPNVPYYVHLVVYGMGNSCSGMYAYLELSLPANTALAIDTTNKVYCFHDNVLLPASDCPQVLPASSYNQGAFEIPSSDSAHGNTWALPQGHSVEIQVPVVSSHTLNNSPLQANVWMLDGNSSPWLHPQQGVYVFSSTPTIIYPSPSTITVTATTAHSQAYLYAHGAGGSGLFELGTDTSYGVKDHLTIPLGGAAWLVWDEWGPPPLQPDTLYHWRFSFTANGTTYYGADQTFRTAPDGRVTVGQGQPGDCSETAFANALATAKAIVFDCGALPITITLSSSRSITSDVTIDGGNKVTLSTSGVGNHFDVQAGTHLTLTQITLVNGVNSDCGGSIHVPADGRLTLNATRLLDNHSGNQGGALCNFGSADITDTFFKGNTSDLHGGAIGNYGTLSLANSTFVSNTASINGGGVDTTVALTVTTSTFVSNTAGYRGGGVNNYLGRLTVSASSFISNTAGAYGGGLSNDAGASAVSSSTFWDNYSSTGGAIESSGALTLTNSTLSANRVAMNGGGLEWVTGSVMTLLNDTIVSNTAGQHGGNLFVGGAHNSSILLKNTLLAFGSPNNCDSTVATQGYNLESANSCGLSSGTDLRNANPLLGPLQDNGGPTWTHALEPGSPAIDKGTSNGCPATDQRGTPRPVGGCDIGAYEYSAKIYLPTVRR